MVMKYTIFKNKMQSSMQRSTQMDEFFRMFLNNAIKTTDVCAWGQSGRGVGGVIQLSNFQIHFNQNWLNQTSNYIIIINIIVVIIITITTTIWHQGPCQKKSNPAFARGWV